MLASIIILAAGKGSRMGLGYNKCFYQLNGKPVVLYSIETFKKAGYTDIILVTNEDFSYPGIKVVKGGKERVDSVYQGLLAASNERVLIHDGARAFIDIDSIKKCDECLKDDTVVFLCHKVTDTIKEVTTSIRSLNRDTLLAAETPQGFMKSHLLEAIQKSKEDGFLGTDDVMLMEKYSNDLITYIINSKPNMKLTNKEDIEEANYLIGGKKQMRIGHAYDIHRLGHLRKLILGGIELDYPQGLIGHSDADCLLHAISEALLGALALGDLGKFFPDNDPKYLNMDSKIILQECYEMIKKRGYHIINIDSTIFAEKPKMRPYIDSMREKIAGLLDINTEQVSVKATTYEGMGPIGEKQGIACEAVILIEND